MAVSHYLVSWIQVGGLIVGLYGFFFLSLGIFGDKSIPWFRALLPAAGMGLGSFVAIEATVVGRHTSLFPAVPWIAGLLVFGEAYGIGVLVVRKSHSATNRVRAGRMLRLARIVTIVCISLATVFGCIYFVGGTNSGTAVYVVIFSAGLILLVWAEVLVFAIPQIAQEALLAKLGFILSALAILTQFLPPVLDLLNIPIR